MKPFLVLMGSFIGATIAGLLFAFEHGGHWPAGAVAGQILWCVFAAGFVFGRRSA
jgi:hypothetical protein